MTGWYLAALLVSFTCMLLVDARWKLALWSPASGNWHGVRVPPGGWRAVVLLLGGSAGFLLWDLVAIDLNFYGRGTGAALLGIEVLPHLPLEEFFFVLFLCHIALVLTGAALRLFGRHDRQDAS